MTTDDTPTIARSLTDEEWSVLLGQRILLPNGLLDDMCSDGLLQKAYETTRTPGPVWRYERTPRGQACLDYARETWEGLSPRMKAQLRCLCGDFPESTTGSAVVAFEKRGLASGESTTPLGRAVLRAGEAAP